MRNDPERHVLKRLNRSSASIPGEARNTDDTWPDPMESNGQEYKCHTAVASRAAKITALSPTDRQVYVQSEINVHHPEAPKPVAVTDVV